MRNQLRGFPGLRGLGRVVGSDPLAPIIADAIGVWSAAGYEASTRKVIKNQVRAGATDPNVHRLPRRAFAETAIGVYGPITNVTVTDNNQAAPDGSMEASTVTSASVIDWAIQANINLPAGTYTIALSVKDLGSSSPNFRIKGTAFTASSSWQRFSVTFAHGGGAANHEMLRAPVALSQVNFAICDCEIFVGSADLNTTWATMKPLCCRTQDLMLGNGGLDSAISVSGGLVDASTMAQVMLPDTAAWSEVTVIYVAKRTTTVTNEYIVGNIGAAATNFQAGPGGYYVSGTLMPGMTSGAAMVGASPSGIHGGNHAANYYDLWVPLGGDLIVGAHRGNASAASSWLNGRKVLQNGVLASITHKGRLAVGALNMTAASQSWAWVAVWSRALTDAEIKAATIALQARFTTRTSLMAYVGTSITALGAADGIGETLTPRRVGVKYAVPGETLTTLNARNAALDGILTSGPPASEALLVVEMGANDLNANPDPAAFTTALAAYIDARRAAGWTKIIATTVMPRTDAGGASDVDFNTARATANATIRSWVGWRIQAVADWAANATMGADGASDNATYFGDKVHPTAAGNTILKAITAAAINSVT